MNAASEPGVYRGRNPRAQKGKCLLCHTGAPNGSMVPLLGQEMSLWFSSELNRKIEGILIGGYGFQTARPVQHARQQTVQAKEKVMRKGLALTACGVLAIGIAFGCEKDRGAEAPRQQQDPQGQTQGYGYEDRRFQTGEPGTEQQPGMAPQRGRTQEPGWGQEPGQPGMAPEGGRTQEPGWGEPGQQQQPGQPGTGSEGDTGWQGDSQQGGTGFEGGGWQEGAYDGTGGQHDGTGGQHDGTGGRDGGTGGRDGGTGGTGGTGGMNGNGF